MAAILASIKRIVAEEDRRAPIAALDDPDGLNSVLELTPAMRIDGANPDQRATSAEAARSDLRPGIDEAAVADIARAVLREELNGPLGAAMTHNVRRMIQEEVARALAART